MTAEELKSLPKEFPMKDFLVWGIPVSRLPDERDAPISQYKENGQPLANWYDVSKGFVRDVYIGDSAIKSVTRNDLNGMLALGYNSMIKLVTGQLYSYNENIQYEAGASIRSDDTWKEFFAQSAISQNKASELSTKKNPSWLGRQTSEHWASVARGEIDDSIAEVSWMADTALPMASYEEQSTQNPIAFNGTWNVCSFTMKRDLYGWISPLLRTYAVAPTPPINRKNGEYVDSVSQNYGMTWSLGDIHGNFNIVIGSSVVTIYWGKGNEGSNTAVRTWSHTTCTVPVVSPMFFRKNVTYMLSVEMKDAFLVSPPGIPSGARRIGQVQFNDFQEGEPAFATAIRGGAPLGASSSTPWPSKKALGFVELICMIPPNRGF